jgi:hypothetical protein
MSLTRFDAVDAAFVDAVARRVVELLRAEGVVSREGPRLLTVAADRGCRVGGVRRLERLAVRKRQRAGRDPAGVWSAGTTAV